VGTPGGTNQSVVVTGGSAELFQTRTLAPASVTGGAMTIENSTVVGGAQCSGTGTHLTLTSNTINDAVSASQGCTALVARNKFVDVRTASGFDGASSVVENNLFLANNSFDDGIEITDATARFNTFVNTSGVDSGATPLFCNGAAVATSNIIAWHSSMIPCASKYTLYDEIAGSRPGTGNKTGTVSTFFKDLAAGDFHLAAGSPAIGGAESGLPTTIDLDGNPRPNPMGSNADIGAYEAP